MKKSKNEKYTAKQIFMLIVKGFLAVVFAPFILLIIGVTFVFCLTINIFKERG